MRRLQVAATPEHDTQSSSPYHHHAQFHQTIIKWAMFIATAHTYTDEGEKLDGAAVYFLPDFLIPPPAVICIGVGRVRQKCKWHG